MGYEVARQPIVTIISGTTERAFPLKTVWCRVIPITLVSIVLFWVGTNLKFVKVRASTWNFDTYHIVVQRRFMRVCAYVQTRQNLCCSNTLRMNVDEDQKDDLYPRWLCQHCRLKEVFTYMQYVPNSHGLTHMFIYICGEDNISHVEQA